jgi:hypothetical protein
LGSGAGVAPWDRAAALALSGDLDGVDNKVIGSIDASQRGWFDGMSRRQPPNMFVVAVVCGAVALCSSGYGQLGRAALQLELERCYVGVAPPRKAVSG